MYTKRLLSAVLFAFVALRPAKSVTPEDVDNSNAAIRHKCVADVGITNDMVEEIHQGNFPDDRRLKCFAACVMRVFDCVTPDGLLDFDKLDRALGTFLDPAGHARAQMTIAHCRQLDYSNDICEASYKYVKCYYDFDSVFIFP